MDKVRGPIGLHLWVYYDTKRSFLAQARSLTLFKHTNNQKSLRNWGRWGTDNLILEQRWNLVLKILDRWKIKATCLMAYTCVVFNDTIHNKQK